MSEKWVSNATTPKPWKLIAGDNYELTKNFKYNNCNDDKNNDDSCNNNNNNIFNKNINDYQNWYYWFLLLVSLLSLLNSLCI